MELDALLAGLTLDAILQGVLLLGGALAGMFYIVATGKIQRRQRERIDDIRQRLAGVSKEVKQARQGGISKVRLNARVFDQLLGRWFPNQTALRERLDRTGKQIAVGDYVLACIGIGGLAAGLLLFVVGANPLVGVAGGVMAGMGIPHMALGRMIGKRLDKFNLVFPDSIDLMVRALKSGVPLQEAMANAGREMREPVGGMYTRVLNEVRLGAQLEDAFWRVADSFKVPELNFLIISMSIQRETGGNLAETLGNLGDLLRQRRQMKLKIKAYSSEARATSMIMGSLPFVLGGVLFLLNPEYISLLFTDSRGHVILGIAGGMMSVGIFLIKRMSNFDI